MKVDFDLLIIGYDYDTQMLITDFVCSRYKY